MHKYRLAVCEDDNVVRDEICRVCDMALTEEKIAHDIIPFSSAEQLEHVLETEGQVFSLLILDIKLEHKTGLELAKELRKKDDRVSILFISGYEEYWTKGYAVQPVQFLMKPLNWEELREAVMTDWRLNHCPKTVLLEKGRRKIRLAIGSIRYVESDGNHGARIILTDGEVSFPAGMLEMEKMLPKNTFIRCHNSYIVNLEHVREINYLTFQMEDGNSVPISRKYYNECQDAFVSYMNR